MKNLAFFAVLCTPIAGLSLGWKQPIYFPLQLGDGGNGVRYEDRSDLRHRASAIERVVTRIAAHAQKTMCARRSSGAPGLLVPIEQSALGHPPIAQAYLSRLYGAILQHPIPACTDMETAHKKVACHIATKVNAHRNALRRSGQYATGVVAG